MLDKVSIYLFLKLFNQEANLRKCLLLQGHRPKLYTVFSKIMNKKISGPVVLVIILIHLALPSTINYLLLLLHFFLQCLKLLPGQDMNLFICSSISCINMAYSTDAAKYQNIKRNDLSTNASQFNVQVGVS